MPRKLKITVKVPDGQVGVYEVDRAVFVLSNDVGEKGAEITGWQYPPGDAEELVKSVRFIADNMREDERQEVQFIGVALNECLDEVLEKLASAKAMIEAAKVNEELIKEPN
jgi:hypothetical protein